jgi:hypothetical protein
VSAADRIHEKMLEAMGVEVPEDAMDRLLQRLQEDYEEGNFPPPPPHAVLIDDPRPEEEDGLGAVGFELVEEGR